MIDVEPFRAYRPELGRIGPLSVLLAPPREETTPEQRDALRRQPLNAAHLFDEQAGSSLRAWLRDDLLLQDSARSLYVVEQEIDGHVRRGFLARVRLFHPPVDNDWLPLLRATQLNLQPALALYPDDDGPIERLAQAISRQPPLQADDPRGGKIHLWPITDQHLISQVTGLMGPRTLLIASGEDMLRAAAAYRDERQALGETSVPAAPIHFALMHLVGQTEPGPDRPLPAGLLYHSLRGL